MTTSTDDRLLSLFPSLHVLRAARLAADPKKMLLGGVGLLVLVFGELLLGLLPFAPQGELAIDTATRLVAAPEGLRDIAGEGSWLDRLRVEQGAGLLLAPLRSVIEPGLVIFQNGNSWSDIAWAWTRLIWALIVWSFFGGAICRMCAMQFAQHERVSPIKALSFAKAQLQNFLVAPFLPLAGILVLLACNALLGLVASLLPGIAVPVLAIVWGLVLFSAFLMAMMLVGLGTGWPLMIAAVSTEDSDGFDGLSRSFGFLTDRPAYAATLALVAAPVFVFGWCVVSLMVALTFSLGQWAVQAGSAGADIDQAVRSENVVVVSNQETRLRRTTHVWAIEPFWIDLREHDGEANGLIWFDPSRTPESDVGFSGRAILCWNAVLLLMLAGYGPSFFWSATTVGYFLLRQSDDGTALDQVADYGVIPTSSEEPAAVSKPAEADAGATVGSE